METNQIKISYDDSYDLTENINDLNSEEIHNLVDFKDLDKYQKKKIKILNNFFFFFYFPPFSFIILKKRKKKKKKKKFLLEL